MCGRMGLGDGLGTTEWGMGVGRDSCPQSCFCHSGSAFHALDTGSRVKFVSGRFHRGWLMSVWASSLSRKESCHLAAGGGKENSSSCLTLLSPHSVADIPSP